MVSLFFGYMRYRVYKLKTNIDEHESSAIDLKLKLQCCCCCNFDVHKRQQAVEQRVSTGDFYIKPAKAHTRQEKSEETLSEIDMDIYVSSEEI